MRLSVFNLLSHKVQNKINRRREEGIIACDAEEKTFLLKFLYMINIPFV
jgi:hypothetical protein